MARKKRRRVASADTEQSLDELDAWMREHVRDLGLRSVNAYLAWCRRHGFARRLQKNYRERAAERLAALRESAIERCRSRRRVRNPAHVVRELLRGRRDSLAAEFEVVARAFRDRAGAPGRTALLRAVLERLVACTPQWLLANSAREVSGLAFAVRLAEHAARLRRQPDSWRPRTKNRERGLLSLLEHVYGEYAVPACLNSAWFAGSGDEAAADHRRWWLHVAQGRNLRTADLPIPYTKKMAHAFAQAPADCSVAGALRFGQVRGLGGDERLARAVASTRLGRGFENDEFWRTVIQFFVRHDIDVGREVTGMVDYLHERRFGSQVFHAPDGRELVQAPAQPHLSMSNRSPTTLRREVAAWHRRLGRRDYESWAASWARSDVPGHREKGACDCRRGEASRGRHEYWIGELCSGEALRLESAALDHCVAIYAEDCARDRSRIHSLRLVHGNDVRPVLTIEVRAGTIVQARGRCNVEPSPTQRAVVSRWARRAGLAIRSSVWLP